MAYILPKFRFPIISSTGWCENDQLTTQRTKIEPYVESPNRSHIQLIVL
jgi:hypothetical protein